ncbi:hypothetical protein [Flavobacterium sandaracinum]|uniref:Uncharacterized protein n=1 Tax=Flavobacterium sandaracinum TaxID=2541733 RepID=A0A4R5CQ11_9FLAO|nr:hypothetical protein [Flavobacterium sandaracinum]TDE01517.1 hypothetical protein E0F91_14275 [Flavobacterium sandaracinum]
MIDNITMVKKSLSEREKTNIIKKSRLVSNSLNGLIYYDNRTTKNFTGGLFIQIDTRNKLKITGSIHKYHSHLESGYLTNFDSFTMVQAKGTFNRLITNTGIDPNDIEVTFFEVGINLKFDIDVKFVLEKVHSIGKMEKPFLIEPKFKESRQITTGTHRDFRVHFKMYDKLFEMQDSRKPIGNFKHHILRIETVHRRVEKLQLNQFLSNEYLKVIQSDFFNQWDGLNFYNDIEAPKGTQRSKIDLVRNIIYKGKITVLNNYKSQYENKALSKRQFYAIRDFIGKWEVIRTDFVVKNSKIVPIWNKSYNAEKQLLIF